MQTLKLPSWAATTLGLLAGVAAILNETVFGLPADWRSYISIGLVFLAGLGIAPIVGPAFRAALHLSQSVSLLLTLALSALALAVHTLNVSEGVRGVLQFVLTFAAAIGFAPKEPKVTAGRQRVVISSKNKFGRLPAFRPPALKTFLEYATTTLKAPAVFQAPAGSYPMDGNDKLGDCTIAGVAHLIAAWNRLFKQSDTVPTVAALEKQYLRLTRGEDTGLVEANVLSVWRKVGLFGQKIWGYAPVKTTDMNAIKLAIAYYGGCYLGIACPESAQRQFTEGVPWTDEGETPEDGHCIVALGFDKHGNLECATWGRIVLVTPGFLAKYLDEAWVVLSHQLIKAGKDTLGLNTAALEADLASV